MTGQTVLAVSVDRKNSQQLDKYRVQSRGFNATMVENNVVGAKAGVTEGDSDGYWVFLTPYHLVITNFILSGS